jgi:TonB family protein
VSKKETDISLIRKYHNGELDARAMHQLERRAQDDPFLMDALEGYENAAGNKQAQLDDLAGRLQQRTAKERRIIPFRLMAIAASILVVLTIGGLWLYRSQPASPPKTAVVIKPEVKTPVATPAAITPEKKQEIVALKSPPPKQYKRYTTVQKADIQADAMIQPVQPEQTVAVESKIANKVAKDTTPLNEIVAMGYADQPKKDVKATASRSVLKEVQITPTDKLLQAKVAGVNTEPRKISPNMQGYFKDGTPNIISGLVIGKNDNLPLPGASVKIAGTNIQAVTDMNGKFVLPVDSTAKAKLVITSIGYQTMQINARDSVKTIALQPNNQSLSEVVVVGYGTQKNAANNATTNAHPKNGQDNFNNYLKENAVSPDGKKGSVTVSFMVDDKGHISDIKVIKSLSKATDQKAIDLINDGPYWIGNANGKPEKVTLKIKFAK